MIERQLTAQDIADTYREVVEEWVDRFEYLDNFVGDELHEFIYDERLVLPVNIQRDVEEVAQCLTRVRYWLEDLRHKLAD
jgi:hypothetical protein